MITPQPKPRYCDYYGMLSLKDFMARQAAGTLNSFEISTRTEEATK